MKKTALCLALCLLLCGCGQQTDLSELYAGCDRIVCTARIEALSLPACEYTVGFVRENGRDTVRVLSPASVAGLSAVIEKGSGVIAFDGAALSAGLPAVRGASPADALSFVFDCMARQPDFQAEGRLDFSEKNGDAELSCAVFTEDGAFSRAEIAFCGDLILKITATSFSIY